MRLQPRGLIGDQGVRRRVALVEAVPGEVLDEAEQVDTELLGVAVRHTAGTELLLLFAHHGGDLLPHRLAKAVGIGHRESGDLLRGLHHLFLEHHDPVGVLEDLCEVIVGIRDGRLAILAVGILEMHTRAERTGPVERVEGDEVFESIGTEVSHEGTHRPSLELEHPDRVAATQHLVDGGVVERHVVDVGARSGVALDQLEGAFDRREVA